MIFRLFEFAAGVYSPMTTALGNYEIYPYVFDSSLMFFALITFNIIHPGQILVGSLDAYPTGKERRAEKKVRKEKKKYDKAVKKTIKRNGIGSGLGDRDESEMDDRMDGFYKLDDVESRGSLPSASTARLV